MVLTKVDKYVQRVLSETPAHVEEVIIEKASMASLGMIEDMNMKSFPLQDGTYRIVEDEEAVGI